MPVAAVYEQCLFLARKSDVRFARCFLPVQPVASEAGSPHGLSDHQFRFGVFGPHAAHCLGHDFIKWKGPS